MNDFKISEYIIDCFIYPLIDNRIDLNNLKKEFNYSG